MNGFWKVSKSFFSARAQEFFSFWSFSEPEIRQSSESVCVCVCVFACVCVCVLIQQKTSIDPDRRNWSHLIVLFLLSFFLSFFFLFVYLSLFCCMNCFSLSNTNSWNIYETLVLQNLKVSSNKGWATNAVLPYYGGFGNTASFSDKKNLVWIS